LPSKIDPSMYPTYDPSQFQLPTYDPSTYTPPTYDPPTYTPPAYSPPAETPTAEPMFEGGFMNLNQVRTVPFRIQPVTLILLQ